MTDIKRCPICGLEKCKKKLIDDNAKHRKAAWVTLVVMTACLSWKWPWGTAGAVAVDVLWFALFIRKAPQFIWSCEFCGNWWRHTVLDDHRD
jgi:hypothetical protein